MSALLETLLDPVRRAECEAADAKPVRTGLQPVDDTMVFEVSVLGGMWTVALLVDDPRDPECRPALDMVRIRGKWYCAVTVLSAEMRHELQSAAIEAMHRRSREWVA